MKVPRSVVEIALDITTEELRRVEYWLKSWGIAYYIEPPKYKTLEEVKIDCERPVDVDADLAKSKKVRQHGAYREID